MKPELKLVHMQLTLRCNLNCSFCGQWGENGFMHGKTAKEIPLANWLKAIEEIKQNNDNPEFIIWGGEPLVSSYFTNIAKALKSNDFNVSLVTNGVLLNDYAEVINECVDTVFVSLDGPVHVHEKLRNRQGIYSKITDGLHNINKSKVQLINLLTICEDNVNYIAEYPYELAELGFYSTIYQNLIYCDSRQARLYKKWLDANWNQKAEKINSWVTDSFGDWTKKLPNQIAKIEGRRYPIKVDLFPFELNSGNILNWFDIDKEIKNKTECCIMPYRHLHITPEGNTHFCVDFNDFSLGNITDSGLYELFNSKAACKFREATDCGQNPLCRRCPWFYNNSIN